MKKLLVTINCLAVYNSSIYVPDNMRLEEAIEYAKEHLDEADLSTLEYVPKSDSLDEDNCVFEEDII